MIKSFSYKITGIVQGVGFRPFIYKIATKLNLAGYVKNNLSGVYIKLEGKDEDIKSFDKFLETSLPPLAKIDKVVKIKSDPLYKGGFEIIDSDIQSSQSPCKTASVPQDSAVCPDCIDDIYNNPKYKNYFGTNCTNCGPRYTIIRTIPYDRVNTSMDSFTMCDDCKSEYNSPISRRYHAQPIGCNSCGPKLRLLLGNKPVSTNDIYKDISKLIIDGKIGAIKGVGGFHIVCDSLNENVVKRLRGCKNRPQKPFAIIAKDITSIKSFAKLSKKQIDILSSKEAPIVILKKLNSDYFKAVAPNIDKIGTMLPYTPFYKLLFEYLQNPIIATSANLSGEPIIVSKNEILEKLSFVDFIVDYNRDIINFIDDSVVQFINGDIQLLRASRGYAPKQIDIPYSLNKKLLAVGGNQKSTISIAFGNKIILSPYIGDLGSIKSFEAFLNTIKTFENFYDFKPDIIISDKHPNYETTKWAKAQNIELDMVQHHISHINSVKAEYNLTDDNYTSFIFDGTGFGDDGTLWGGEIFTGDMRKYFFKPIKLIGGEKAIKEPKRVALGLLFEYFSLNELLNLDNCVLSQFTNDEIKQYHKLWSKNLNTPKSSSVGRLFDAVVSLSDILHIQTYEGESGILSEMVYNKKSQRSFLYNIKDQQISIEFEFEQKDIVTPFINCLINIISDIAKKEGNSVILGGGVFQNKILLEGVTKQLDQIGIKYYYNKTIPINDSGISVGQIWSYILNNK